MDQTVLVVDDDPDVRFIIKAVLERLGYEVLDTPLGARALQLARNVRPRLILCDMMMPSMDGVEVLRALRANVETAPIPVIMLTVVDDPEMQKQALKAGANDFLSKPVDIEVLEAHVRNLVGDGAA